MVTAEEFISICKKAIENYKSGNVSLKQAAAKINNNPFEYPLEDHAHPMLYKVAALAFDIAEDYRTEKEDITNWETLTKTLERYEKGDWEPTCWILSAMYGEYEKNSLIHSYSSSIRRQNGKTIIETASNIVKKSLEATVANVNPVQTDERYMGNVLKLLPNKVGKLKLTNSTYGEYLIEPYYSTHL